MIDDHTRYINMNFRQERLIDYIGGDSKLYNDT